jgi:four helix bundle protein
MFIAYEVARELINALAPLVVQIKREDRELADQLKRAAQSVLLKLAEGQKYSNGNRLRHYEIAQGSANEVKAALDAGVCMGLDRGGWERACVARSVARADVEAHALARIADHEQTGPAGSTEALVKCR